MTKTLFFDIETNGLDPSLIHCLVIIDENDKEFTFTGNDIPNGTKLLTDNLIVGHNCIGYDLPVLNKLLNYSHKRELVHDTLCLSRLIYPDIANSVDVKLLVRGTISKNSVGKHSLKSWGERLQFQKLDYQQNNPDAFEKFDEKMLEYCIQDVRLTKKLYEKFMSKGFSKESIELEHKISFITKEQELRGFYFDEKKAQSLQAKLLSKYNDLKLKLEKTFIDWEEDLGEFIPKVNSKKFGYKKGIPVRKTKLVKFNPSSRQHIANRLTTLHGWKPKEFTPTGTPIIDEDVLSSLPYPEAKLLNEYLLIEKRLGMLSEGANGYLKVVKKGKIHTSYITNIVTGRMSSRYPNLQNIPNTHSLYGKEFRELFIPKPNYVMVGVDAQSLEAVCFAHYIYNYKGGKEYADLILNGDFHTYNMKAAGLQSRELSKTMFYALLYGSSFKRLSEILDCPIAEAKDILDRFYRQLPFLKQIKTDIIEKIEAHGVLKAVDQRILTVRSNHATLNTLIQSCGAIIMKKALTILWDNLKDKDAWVVATIHDEFQIEAKKEEAEFVGQLAVDSIKKAGEYFKLRVPISASFRVGNNWSETH
jgi:DNA polymerase-1